MKIALDTGAYSAMMAGDAQILDLLRAAQRVAISPIVLGELEVGFRYGARHAADMERLRKFIKAPSVDVPPIGEETASRYSELHAWLKRKGSPIPINDVWIAASALEWGHTLVTFDSDFRRIPLLPVLPR